MGKMSWTEQLQFVNAFFNNRGSRSDLENYGEEEYWAAPEEFLQRGGDCEDFALAKYLALRYFGWPEKDLWVLLVEKKQEDSHHAALAVRRDGKIFILDNLSRPAHLLLTEKQFMRGFSPLYAINAFGVWRFAPPDGGQPAPAQ
jgi:predicted transglutaminase-like cysteine proteinase